LKSCVEFFIIAELEKAAALGIPSMAEDGARGRK